MKPLTKAIVVALIQVLIVCSLGAKLLYDRHTRPQACSRQNDMIPTCRFADATSVYKSK